MKNSIQNKKFQLSLKNRITAIVMSFVMLLQILFPGIAAAVQIVSDNYVAEAMVNPLFQQSQNNAWLYEKAEFAEATNLQHQSIETFHSKLREAKFGLSNPTMVPIAGDITIFVPVYLPGKLLGDAYVQNRFIRQQIVNQLGRHIIDPVAYATEVDQNNTLYNNAYSFANENRQYIFGNKLPSDLVITRDMVWPEKRNINGQDVIAPIVYLTPATLQKWSVSDHKIEFLGNSATFRSVVLDHTTLMTGRDTWINTVKGFSSFNGNVAAEGNLNLNVGGIFQNIGGSVFAANTVTILAGQINNKTLVHAYTDKYGQGTRLGQIASMNGPSIHLFSKNDITFEGSTATATNGTITMEAGGNISILPVFTQYQRPTQDGHWQGTYSSLDVFGSKISATDTIKLIADGAITIDASELVSTEGGIELLASQGIHVLDELTHEQIQKVDRKGKTTGQSSEFRTEAVRAVLSAGKGVLLDTEFGDVTLKASKITSNDGAQVYARNGTVHLLMTKELEEKHLQTVRKGTWKIKTRTEDIVHENNIQNAIVGGLQVQAMYGINLEYTGKEGATLQEQIEEFRSMPGMEWAAQLYDQSLTSAGGNIDWQVMEEIHKEIKKSKSTLSPAAMAIIAICVAVAMGPAGASLVGSSGGGALAAISSSVGGGAFGAAMSAGALTLTTQAVQSVASGNNLRETLNAMDSDESLKSLAVSMVTAGAMQAAQVDMFKVPEGASVDALNLAKQAGQAVVNSAVSAGVSTLVYGGNSEDFLNSFKQGLMTSAVNKIGEKMANKIGGAYRDGDVNNAVRYIAHAAAGCVLASAQGSINQNGQPAEDNCSSGAAGAVAGELSADAYRAQNQSKIDAITNFIDKQNEYYDSLREIGYSPEEAAKIMSNQNHYYTVELNKLHAAGVDIARLVGGLSAVAIGGDVNLGAQAGANAAANNALFLIPLALIALKAADLYFTAEEIWDIYKAYEESPEKGDEALKQYLIEQGQGALISKIVPGAKTLESVFDILKNNGVISPKIIDGVQKYLTDKKTNETNQQNWTGERAPINTHNAGPNAPDYKKWIGDCDGCSSKGTVYSNPDGTVTYVRNDGVKVTYVDGRPVFDEFMTHPSGVTKVQLNQPFAPGDKRYRDYKAANEAVGHPEWGDKPPTNWTWHHNEDGKTMMLIPRDIHSSFTHQGGVSLTNE